MTPCSIIDDNIFDPSLQTGGNPVERKGQAADDDPIDARDEQHRVGAVDQHSELVGVRWRGRLRQLRNQMRKRGNQLIVNDGCHGH